MSLVSCAVSEEANKINSDNVKKYQHELLPKLKDLTERVQLLSWALQQNVIDTYINYTVTKSLEQLNFKSRKLKIDNDYNTLEEELRTFTEDFNDNDGIMKNAEALHKSYHILKDLCVLGEAKSVINRANHEFNRYNYSEAMLSLKNLKGQLDNVKADGNVAKVVLNLYDHVENQLALFTAHLSIEWEDVFTWSEKKGLNFLIYSLSVQQSDQVLLQRILNTLYVTDRMKAELWSFSDFFINKLVHNVIRHNCDIFTEDHIGAIVFNIKIDLSDNTKPNYQTIFNNLTAIFEFLQSTLGSQFQSDETFTQIFAKSIKSDFFDKIIEDCVRSNLQSYDGSYQSYKNIVIELDSFNKFLIEIKFVDPDDSPLNSYIENTECLLYNKKCEKLLINVRSLISQSLSYDSIEVGSTLNDNKTDQSNNEIPWDLNAPVYLPKCMISRNVKTIMTLIKDHLEESSKLPEKYSMKFVSYIKDIAVMYQCVVPRKFKINLESCPSDIALFFNNCYYLAHGLVGPPWCTTLPQDLADRLVLVLFECIQDLRVLGLEKLSLYLQQQKTVIQEGIQPKESTSWTHEEFEHFDCGINRAMTLMKELKTSWLHILPSRMYVMSMCTLIEVLCETVLNRIFCDIKHVSEDLVYLIATRIEDTLEEVVTLFEEPIELEEQISIWIKFSRMPLLLKAQLLEISELWNKDRELFSDYTCEEFRHVVKMRFADDKYRLKILKEIQ